MNADDNLDLLVVDDTESNLLAAEAALEGLGARVVKAGSGRQALRYLLDDPPCAAVLMDVQMPDCDGFQTAELIRQREGSQRIPILFVTAHQTDDARIFRGYALGAVDFLVRPVAAEILRAKVGVFVELARSMARVRRQSELLLEQERVATGQALEKAETTREQSELRARLLVELEKAHAESEQARERSEERSRHKSRFLAGMGHELKTPLSSIIGFTSLLLMKASGPLTADQEEQLGIIRTSAHHLLSLVNELLDLARLEMGSVKLAVEPVACRAVLDEVARTLRPMAAEKGLDFGLAGVVDNLVLLTNRRSLVQILLNLASNALKYTERGSVTLTLRRPAGEPGQVEFGVLDTGRGIRPEDEARLFQLFTDVEEGRRAPASSGVGLHVSQRLAGMLGGAISYRPRDGGGSQFTLALPDRALAASEAVGCRL